jgi:hypothetical protein
MSVSCTDIPPGFTMKCSANVMMNITTTITTGTISIGVLVGGTDQIKTTIKIIPDTSPGALTAQIPETGDLGAGCTSGQDALFLYVYDGDYRTDTNPGGRALHSTTVPTTMSCTH